MSWASGIWHGGCSEILKAVNPEHDNPEHSHGSYLEALGPGVSMPEVLDLKP